MLTHKIHSELDDVYIGRKLTFFWYFINMISQLCENI